MRRTDLFRFPKGKKSQAARDAWGQQILRSIESSDSSLARLKERWDVDKGNYYNAPRKRTDVQPWQSQAHYNLVQVKLDQIGSIVVGTIVEQTPICTAEGSPYSWIVERAVNEMLLDADIRHVLSRTAIAAGWSGKAHVRCMWDTAKSRLSLKCIPPNDFVAHPSELENLEDMSVVGHRFNRRHAEIQDMIQLGEYLDADYMNVNEPVSQRNQTDLPTSAMDMSPASIEEDDYLVELADILVRAKGDDDMEEWWSVTLTVKDGKFLRCEPYYDWKQTWYASFSYKAVDGGYWLETSPANDLQGVQEQANESLRIANDTMVWNAHGFMLGPRMPGKGFKGKLAPGVYFPTASPDQTQYHTPKADASLTLPLLAVMDRKADEIVRISPMATGQQHVGINTATEAQAILAGQQTAINSYISVFGLGVSELFEIAYRELRAHLEEWQDEWLSLNPTVDVEQFKDAFSPETHKWHVRGTRVNSNPQNVLNMSGMLLQLSTNPQTGLDPMALTAVMLDAMERMGFVGAKQMQNVTPALLVERLAVMINVPPDLLAEALTEALGIIQDQQQLANEAMHEETIRSVGEHAYEQARALSDGGVQGQSGGTRDSGAG